MNNDLFIFILEMIVYYLYIEIIEVLMVVNYIFVKYKEIFWVEFIYYF